MSSRVPLTALSRELAALTGKPAPSYRKLYVAILDGKLPAEQVDGRYLVDVQVAAQALGLTPERIAA
jgi:hypothetical protein